MPLCRDCRYRYEDPAGQPGRKPALGQQMESQQAASLPWRPRSDLRSRHSLGPCSRTRPVNFRNSWSRPGVQVRARLGRSARGGPCCRFHAVPLGPRWQPALVSAPALSVPGGQRRCLYSPAPPPASFSGPHLAGEAGRGQVSSLYASCHRGGTGVASGVSVAGGSPERRGARL